MSAIHKATIEQYIKDNGYGVIDERIQDYGEYWLVDVLDDDNCYTEGVMRKKGRMGTVVMKETGAVYDIPTILRLGAVISAIQYGKNNEVQQLLVDAEWSAKEILQEISGTKEVR